MKKTTSVLCVIAALSGCATPATPEMFGPAPTSDAARLLIDHYLRSTLIDPDSLAQFNLLEPPRMCTIGVFANAKHYWCVPFEYNAKNRFGGYVGRQLNTAMIQHGQIVDMGTGYY